MSERARTYGENLANSNASAFIRAFIVEQMPLRARVLGVSFGSKS